MPNEIEEMSRAAASRIRCLEVWKADGWRLKVYEIADGVGPPGAELIAAAKEVARARLPRPARDDRRHGVGFIGVHRGRDANVAFVSWWEDGQQLHHHVYAAPPDAPSELSVGGPHGSVGSVWELAVVGFERDAWLKRVVAHGGGADLEGYLADRLTIEG